MNTNIESDFTLTTTVLPLELNQGDTVHNYIVKKAKENIARKGQNANFVVNVITGEELKLIDLEPQSRKIASALTKHGFKKGDTLIYAADNVTKVFLCFIGVWRCGGIIRSSYPEDTVDTVVSRVNESKARFILCDAKLADKYLAATKLISWPVEVIVCEKHGDFISLETLLEDNGSDFPNSVQIHESDPCLVLCTSGTTGFSKGAIHTHGSLLSLLHITEMATIGKYRILPKSILMLGRTVHLSGSVHIWRTLVCGIDLFLMHTKSPEYILKAVDKYKPTMVFGFPTFIEFLVEGDAEKYDCSSVEGIIARGCTLSEKFMTKMHRLTNLKYIHSGYALTENPSVTTTFDLLDSGPMKLIPDLPMGSIGKLFPNTSLRILDLETNAILGPGEPGELVVKSPLNIKGYWNLPKETERLFVDGFLRTGDLGYYDANGFVFFIDRVKETFKYFNMHISPSEIEGVLNDHPAVKMSCVVGVPDPAGGDTIPRAFIVLRPNFETSTTEEIKQFAEKKLASYKHLRGGVFIVEAIPIGKTGKMSRKLVAESMKVCDHLK